jgi:hypothetical protein
MPSEKEKTWRYERENVSLPWQTKSDDDSVGANKRACYQFIGASSPNKLRQTKSSDSAWSKPKSVAPRAADNEKQSKKGQATT